MIEKPLLLYHHLNSLSTTPKSYHINITDNRSLATKIRSLFKKIPLRHTMNLRSIRFHGFMSPDKILKQFPRMFQQFSDHEELNKL